MSQSSECAHLAKQRIGAHGEKTIMITAVRGTNINGLGVAAGIVGPVVPGFFAGYEQMGSAKAKQQGYSC
jgi:hypothetical protein